MTLPWTALLLQSALESVPCLSDGVGHVFGCMCVVAGTCGASGSRARMMIDSMTRQLESKSWSEVK